MRLGALTLIALLVAAGPAAAQDVDALLRDVLAQHYAIEAGAEPVDIDVLAEALAKARADGVDLAVVVLADDPRQGALAVADAVLRGVARGTVLVVSPTDVAAASAEHPDQDVHRALEGSATALGGPIPAGVAAFAAELEELPASRGGGTGLWWGLLAAAVVLAAFGLVLRARTNSAIREQREPEPQPEPDSRLDLQEARAELDEQVRALSDAILELSDRAALAPAPVSEAFDEAHGAYEEVRTRLEQPADARELEVLSDRVDVAQWQLEVVRARMEGRQPPAPPDPHQRATCFFDPTHGAGTDTATVRPAAAEPAADTPEPTVRVCPYCAARLGAGAPVEPRLVDVGGRRVPIPMAPRHHGGGGFGWLGAFTMVLPSGRALPYDWSGYAGGGRHRR